MQLFQFQVKNLGLLAAFCLALGGAGASSAQNPDNGSGSPAFRPYAPQISYMPLSRLNFPLQIAASLKQAAINNREKLSPSKTETNSKEALLELNKDVLKPTSRFFNNRLAYRPAALAASAYLEPQNKTGLSNYNAKISEAEERRIRLATELRDQEDETKILAALLQVAQGLGIEQDNDIYSKGKESLDRLCGKGQGDWAVEKLKNWLQENRTAVPLSAKGKTESSLDELEQVEALTRELTAHDSECSRLRAELGVNCQDPNGLEKSLSAVSMVPIIFTRVASLAQSGIEMGNGGGRIKRLADVLYLGQALENRVSTLSKQAHLLVSAQKMAVLTENDVLYGFSKTYAEKLAGH